VIRSLSALVAPAFVLAAPPVPAPILSGHSHNDYEREVPLLQALEAGLVSLEIDVHLVDGALVVGHDEEDLDPGRTIESLYLDPLRTRVRAGGGRVVPSPHALLLIVDIKTDAEPTYLALRRRLAAYPDLFVEQGPVEVVVSGNRPRELMMSEAGRLATYDGRLSDLDVEIPPGFIALVSDDWEEHFEWRGQGEMPDRDREKLARVVRDAHRRGWRIRFWKTPRPEGRPIEEIWATFLAAGVDLLGTDEPERYRDFVVKLE
jgi:hypothetical protein